MSCIEYLLVSQPCYYCLVYNANHIVTREVSDYHSAKKKLLSGKQQ